MSVPATSSFDANFYLASNKDVKTAAEAAVKNGTAGNLADFAYDHWLNYGAREARNPNAFFNTTEYLSANKDVQRAFNANGLNPLTHYDNYGWSEKRGTGVKEAFDVAYYIAANTASVSNGSPLNYLIMALRAAATASTTTTLSFPASAYAPTVAYSVFDFVDYLSHYSDVAKWVLGDQATVPTSNTALNLVQKGKVLYHWFNYGQLEGRVTHTIGSANDNLTSTVSDFNRITDPVQSFTNWDISVATGTDPRNYPGTSPTSYTATAADDTFSFYVAPNADLYTLGYKITVTGWGGANSAFIWDSAGGGLHNMTVTGVTNIIFANKAGQTAPAGASATAATILTVSGGTNMSFADATVTELAVIHADSYKVNDSKTVTGHNNSGMAFYNISANTSSLVIQSLTKGEANDARRSDGGADYDNQTMTAQYDLFGYKGAPANNTVMLTLNNVLGKTYSSWGHYPAGNSREDLTVVNISSKSANDIKTLKIYAQANVDTTKNESVVRLTAGDGDGNGTDLVAQLVSSIVITGDKDVKLTIKDGVGTNTFTTLDVSGFKGTELKFTNTYSNHLATVLGSSAKLTFASGHEASDLYGQTFQFGTTDMGTNKAGSLAAVKTVGQIHVTNKNEYLKITDYFNLSTKIFGITSAQWATVNNAASKLDSTDGVIRAGAGANGGSDSYFYAGQGGVADDTGFVGYTLSDTAVDLSFGKTAAGQGHAAIVLLQAPRGDGKLNIYFTDDNTQFNTAHATLIGSYGQGGILQRWGTDSNQLLDSTHFNIVA